MIAPLRRREREWFSGLGRFGAFGVGVGSRRSWLVDAGAGRGLIQGGQSRASTEVAMSASPSIIFATVNKIRRVM